MTVKEFKAYFTSRKLVFCKTPEELRKALIKFEWKKEDKMDEITKITNEIERKISGMIQHMENFTVALKELVPKVIEKEVGLKDGQIYKCCAVGNYNGIYYLLIQFNNQWELKNLSHPDRHWVSYINESHMKQKIKKDFILCPYAKIVVLPKFPDGGSDL